jgi:hypothetical protein
MGPIVATDRQFLRFFSYTGVQTGIRSIPGPVISIAGSANLLFVTYHQGGSFHGKIDPF